MTASKIQKSTRRWLAVATIVLAGLVASGFAASPASAADYDFRGGLITASQAASSAGLQCDPYGGKLAITFGTNGVAPHYYAYATKNRNDAVWSEWSTWGNVNGSRFIQQGIITTPGDWEVVVVVAHWSNNAWYYDAEFTNVTNDHPLYDNSRFCHVGF